jgi:PAS domain S-box-containing protein
MARTAPIPAPPEEYAGWEHLFYSVFERSSNAIVLFDEQRVIVDANPVACNWYGTSRSELIRSRGERFVAPEDRWSWNTDWRKLWATGECVGERTVLRANGSRIHVQFDARTIEIAGRRIAVSVWLEVQSEEELEHTAQLGDLTPREREIVRLVALGQTSPQIADELFISAATVGTHVRNAMVKAGARTRAHLVAMSLAATNRGRAE